MKAIKVLVLFIMAVVAVAGLLFLVNRPWLDQKYSNSRCRVCNELGKHDDTCSVKSGEAALASYRAVRGSY